MRDITKNPVMSAKIAVIELASSGLDVLWKTVVSALHHGGFEVIVKNHSHSGTSKPS